MQPWLTVRDFFQKQILNRSVWVFIYLFLNHFFFPQLTYGCGQILRERTLSFTLMLIFCLISLPTWSVSLYSLLQPCSFNDQCEVTKLIRDFCSLSLIRWAVINGSLCVFFYRVTTSSMLMCGLDYFTNFWRPTFCSVNCLMFCSAAFFVFSV